MIYSSLFFLYLVLASYFIYLITKRLFPKYSVFWFLSAFLFKVLLGCIYGAFYKHQMPNADTWNFFLKGLELNKSNWKSVLNVDTSKDFNLLSTNSYFNYYRYVIMDMLSALFSLFSGGRYYVNVIFFNFITFFGILQFYRFLVRVNPIYTSAFFLALFFFPPFVFWTSGFHRDGLLMAALGSFLFNSQIFFSSRKIRFLLFSIAAVGLMLFMRSFWGLSSFIIGIVWFGLRYSNGKNVFWRFSLCTGFLLVLFFLSSLAPSSLNFFGSLIKKQHAFLSLNGNSELPITRLSNEPISFIKAFFNGIDHLMFRPYLNQVSASLLYWLAFLENIFILLVMCLAIIYGTKYKSNKPLSKPENNVLLFLAIINYTIIGITVPFLGAIVRYKAPFEVVLIVVLIQYIPSDLLDRHIRQKINVF